MVWILHDNYKSERAGRARVCSELKLPSPVQKDAARVEKTALEELATDKFFLESSDRLCKLIGNSRSPADRPSRLFCDNIRKEQMITSRALEIMIKKDDSPHFEKALAPVLKMDTKTASAVIKQVLSIALKSMEAWPTTRRIEGLTIMLWEQMRKNYPDTIQKLAKALKNPVVIERNWAAEGLERFGALASKVRPQLIKTLFDKDSSNATRASILETLKKMRSKENVPVFIRVLTEHRGKDYRSIAAQALSELDPKAYTYLFAELVNDGNLSPSIVDALVKDDSTESTLALCQALFGTFDGARGKAEAELIRRAMGGSDISATVPILAKILGNNKGSPFSQMSAARVLGYTHAKEAAYPLVSALKFDASPATRATAADALGELGDEAGAYWLLEAALNDKDSGVRRHAVSTLGRFGEKANWTKPDIERMLKGKDPDLRLAANKALAMMGSKEAFGELAKVVSNKVCNSASCIEILEVMMESDPEAAKPLAEKHLKELRDSEICYTLAAHIRTNGASSSFAAIAIPILKSFALSESYPDHIREQPVRALGYIGNESAIKALAEIESNAKSQAIKRIAAEELRRICNPV